MLMSERETIAIISDLIRGLRHELGNLTTVLNFDLAALETAIRDKQTDVAVVSGLKANLIALNEILLRLKQYPQPQIHLGTVDLHEILMSAAEHACRQTGSNMGQFAFRPADGELLIHADDAALLTAFGALIKNAVEANRKTGGQIIEVAMRPERDDVIVQIGDAGPGFDERTLAAAFSPSFTTRMTEGFARGLGFGLFTAQAVVLLHEGTIQLANKPGRGALVTVRLPLLDRT